MFDISGKAVDVLFHVRRKTSPPHTLTRQQAQLSPQIISVLWVCHHFITTRMCSGETLVLQSDLHDWSRAMGGLCGRKSRMNSTLLALPASLNSNDCQNIKGQIWEMEKLWKGLKHAQRFYHQPRGTEHLTEWTLLSHCMTLADRTNITQNNRESQFTVKVQLIVDVHTLQLCLRVKITIRHSIHEINMNGDNKLKMIK